jgi:hypothetical protein
MLAECAVSAVQQSAPLLMYKQLLYSILNMSNESGPIYRTEIKNGSYKLHLNTLDRGKSKRQVLYSLRVLHFS